MSEDLIAECMELSLDWESTEEIVQGCVDLVTKKKDAEIARLKAKIKWLEDGIFGSQDQAREAVK